MGSSGACCCCRWSDGFAAEKTVGCSGTAVLLVDRAGGCGAGRLIPSSGGPGSGTTVGNVTPTGTYNIVVTGTSAGLTRSVNLTLVVQ